MVRIDPAMPVLFRRRLYEVGLYAGTRIKVLKVSALKKSILIRFNDLTLTILKEYADMVFVRE